MTPETDPRNFTRNPAAADIVWDAIETLAEGVAVYDSDHRLVTCNQRYIDMFPLISDLIQRDARWEDLLRAGAERGQYREAIGRVEEFLAERLKLGARLRVDKQIQKRELTLANGQVYETQFSPIKQEGFVVTNIDITERRHAEAAARDQESILRTVLDASPAAVVMARLEDGRILYRSPGAISLFGNTTNALAHYANPKDREIYVQKVQEQGRVDDHRITLIDSEGRHRATSSWGRLAEFEGDTYVVTAIMDLTDQQEREAMVRSILEACPAPIQMTMVESGEIVFSSPETIALFGRRDNARTFYADPDTRERYLRQLRRDGAVSEFKAEYINAKNERFWGAVSARLIEYDGKEVVVSHTRDLTEQLRIEAELAQQQDQLYQNEKMSAMGELLAGVAHELNNPLSVVVGHSLMLRDDCKDPATLKQVEKISQAAERCAKIVKTFLTMARQQPVKMQRVDINEVIQTAVDVASYGDKASGVVMQADLGAGLPRICADPDQITQVFINLILNAEQAIRDGGTGTAITVAARAVSGGQGVEITVEDDGPGIPENIRGRVFEPFFTTKEVGDGTGIGLALCHRIIQSHNGTITVGTGSKGGSLFKIVLPVDTEPPAKSEARNISQLAAAKIRIVIVDDEEDVAELNAEILTRSGYAVDVFNTPDKALESMRDHPYDLILSDLNMPGIDGRGFFDIIKRDFPQMVDKTGFVTGDTMGRSSQAFLSEAKRPCVEKPVSPKDLRAFVAEIIATAEQNPE